MYRYVAVPTKHQVQGILIARDWSGAEILERLRLRWSKRLNLELGDQ